MRKRKKEDAGEGAYWMDTYGDMVTLLLTFFVFLYSFSTIDAAKWEELANALSGTPIVAVEALSASDVKAPAIEGQNTTDAEPSPTPAPTGTQAMSAAQVAEAKEQFNELYDKMKMHIETNGLQDKLNVEMQDGEILMTMNETALFDSGSDVLKPDAREILPTICDLLNQYDPLLRWIRIEGHTDDVPIQNSKFRDNWELSNARAYSVLDYVLSLGINPYKVGSTGLGEYHPVVPNDSKENQARNRRVDFVIESILKDNEE